MSIDKEAEKLLREMVDKEREEVVPVLFALVECRSCDVSFVLTVREDSRERPMCNGCEGPLHFMENGREVGAPLNDRSVN